MAKTFEVAQSVDRGLADQRANALYQNSLSDLPFFNSQSFQEYHLFPVQQFLTCLMTCHTNGRN